jgi:hypothetical protein
MKVKKMRAALLLATYLQRKVRVGKINAAADCIRPWLKIIRFDLFDLLSSVPVIP